MQIVAHKFAPHDLVAGHAALDFVNTVTARDLPTPFDWLDGFDRLLDWAALAKVATSSELELLRDNAKRTPRRGAAALTEARQFREAFHALCVALIASTQAPAPAVKTVEATWKRALARATLIRVGGNIEPTITIERSGLGLITDRIAVGALDLIRRFPSGRAHVCLGTRCGWLFVDTSKGGRRVWCDMATCGNAAKSRRHQQRRRPR